MSSKKNCILSAFFQFLIILISHHGYVFKSIRGTSSVRLYTCFTLSRSTCSRDDDYSLASICLDVLRSQNKNAEAEDCEEAELFTPVEQLEV